LLIKNFVDRNLVVVNSLAYHRNWWNRIPVILVDDKIYLQKISVRWLYCNEAVFFTVLTSNIVNYLGGTGCKEFFVYLSLFEI